MQLFINTYKEFSGAIITPPSMITQTLNCALGYECTTILFDTATNLPLVGAVNSTTITLTQIKDNCTGNISIVAGDADIVQQAIDNPCCVQYFNSANFVNFAGDTTFPAVVGSGVNFPKVAVIDLLEYGGGNVVVYNDQDIINAFGNLPTPIDIQIIDGVPYFASDYLGPITDIEVSESLLSGSIIINGNLAPVATPLLAPFVDNNTIIFSSTDTAGNAPTAPDKFRIKATMNTTILDSGLVNWGDVAALVALPWHTIGLTRNDGTPLTAANFIVSGTNMSIVNAAKNKPLAANFAVPLVVPIPNKNLAHEINFEYTFYEDGIYPSLLATNTINTGRYLEYLSSQVTRWYMDSPANTIRSSAFLTFSNVFPIANTTPYSMTIDGVTTNNIIANSQIIQSKSKWVFGQMVPEQGVGGNFTDHEVKAEMTYMLPYAGVNVTTKGNNWRMFDAGTSGENYDFIFFNNRGYEESPYTMHAQNYNFGFHTPPLFNRSNITYSLNGVTTPWGNRGSLLTGAGTVPGATVDLINLPVDVIHNMRLELDQSGEAGIPAQVINPAPFKKYSELQFVVSKR